MARPNGPSQKMRAAQSQPNVLKQSGEGTYPWCVKSCRCWSMARRSEVQADLGHEEDQQVDCWQMAEGSATTVGHWANALEDNATIYHTGKRRRVLPECKYQVTSGEWHTLRIDFKGEHFTVSFDGKKVIEAEDETFAEARPSGSGPGRQRYTLR